MYSLHAEHLVGVNVVILFGQQWFCESTILPQPLVCYWMMWSLPHIFASFSSSSLVFLLVLTTVIALNVIGDLRFDITFSLRADFGSMVEVDPWMTFENENSCAIGGRHASTLLSVVEAVGTPRLGK